MASIASFLDWWLDGLARALALPMPARRASVILVENGDQYDCYRAEHDKVEKLGAFAAGDRKLVAAAGGRPVELRLDRDRLISKVLHLPAASHQFLPSVVRHQLEHLTPWKPEHLAYDFAVEDDADGDQISVRVVATSREIVADALARLDGLGVTVNAVGTSEDPLDTRCPINVLDGGGAKDRARLKRAIGAALAVLLVLGGALGSYATWRLARLDNAQAGLVADIAARRQAIATLVGAAPDDIVMAFRQRKKALPAVVVIDAVSQLLPAHTYLRQLEIDGETLRLNGFSTAATDLIRLIEASDMFADARFIASTVRVDEGGYNAFQIEAHIVPPDGDAQ